MKYVDEYRSGALAQNIVQEIRRMQTRPWVIMEVCGGQTHSIVKHGIDELLPEGIELVHGPGCPVCVTSLEMMDKAHAIAQRREVIFTSFGDMLRVPGSQFDLFTLKSHRRANRLFPAGCAQDRARQPGKESGLFCNRF